MTSDLYDTRERRLMVVKSLRKHKQLKGLSVTEIASKKGMFPSDVEQSFKELHREGLAKCYIYRGQLYAVLQDDPKEEFYDMPEDDDSSDKGPKGKHVSPSMFG